MLPLGSGRPAPGAAGLLEVERKFRRVKGYRGLEQLERVLNPELHSQKQVA